ncbi:MAG: response regulator transcription factor [Oxalobacter sp.]
MKIYLADTDTQAFSRTVNGLYRAGFDCEMVSIASGFHEFASRHPNPALKGVFLLGAGISDRSKRTWTTQLKTHYPDLALLTVTVPGQIDQIQTLLQAGVDDWVSPSAHAQEWIARIGLLLRQKYPDSMASRVLDVPPYIFTCFPNRVFREGQEIVLTAKEYDVAFFLFSHVGQTLSRQLICEMVWKRSLSKTGRTVDTHVSRVRSRLGLKDGVYGYVLEQLYGYGYLLRHF